MMKLLVVESPKKCRSIGRYLGSGWKVVASVGHICDLPPRQLGVDPDSYQLAYESDARQRKAINHLKAAAAQCNAIYLAPDPDREGEAIAWHVARILGCLQTAQRVTFNQITKKAVQAAVAAPGRINMNLVDAQQARRAIDRLVGYRVSGPLSNAQGQKLSAGRVQTIAVRFVVEREREINDFKPQAYFDVLLSFVTEEQGWQAQWIVADYLPPNQRHCFDRQLAGRIAAVREVELIRAENETKYRQPAAPFTTSTLQQAASSVLKLGPKQTMKAAQALYEAGLITYHRTDNPNLSDEAIEQINDWLISAGQAGQVLSRPRTFKAKADAQEAHEAVRPTAINNLHPEDLDGDEARLYQLIWYRSIASQMQPAQYNVYQVELQALETIDEHRPRFEARSRRLIKPGWLGLPNPFKNKSEKTERSEKEADDNQVIPVLSIDIGGHLAAIAGEIMDKKTKAPGRYTEASLIDKLEQSGVGRPSTYASIMETIKTRGYAKLSKRHLYATEAGCLVVDGTVGRFQFAEADYTKAMEAQLDDIAAGTRRYRATVAALDEQLTQELGTLAVEGPGIDQHYPCTCQQGFLQKRPGKHGPFWGCSAYPSCKETRPDFNGEPGVRSPQRSVSCGCTKSGQLVLRSGSKGKFWGCNQYPKCKTTFNDKNGQPDR